jgi:hypothetical protein
MRARHRLILLSVLWPIACPPQAIAADCLAAAAAAEQQYAIPAGLLAAIGTVESGRLDQASGRILPWPWTIDAAGASQFPPSLPDAVTTLSGLERQGVRLIDVGCFQIDLTYHPDAFASARDAFDPVANARYAARFLADLHRRFGSWTLAVMNYHSAWPDSGTAYEQRVLALWHSGDKPLPVFGMRIWTPANTPPEAIHPEVIVLGRSLSLLPTVITPVTAP